MDALTALQQRVSCGLLEEPGPSEEMVNQLIKAAVRAPDHKNLRPWRFVVLTGEGRNKLADLLAQAVLHDNPDASSADLEKARKKPFRAPMIILVIAEVETHPKVPRVEQLISAGAAANNIVTAAFAFGIGAYWRTGNAARHPVVKVGFGLKEEDEIVGFIYLGTPRTRLKPIPEIPLGSHLQWLK